MLVLVAAIVTVAGGALAPSEAKTAQANTVGYNRSEIKSLVRRIAGDVGISKTLALAVAHAESDFDPAAESRKGARGVMQIMPATARGEYRITANRLWDPRVNIALGLHYLQRLISRYDGRTDLALSFYNGGSAVDRYGRQNPQIIPYTRAYVDKVLRLQRRYQRQIAKP